MSNINLLPWRMEKIYYKNNVFYFVAGVAAALILALIILFNIYLKFVTSFNQGSIDYLRSEIMVYENKAKEISGLKERRKILLNRLEVINSLQSKRFSIVEILGKIVQSIPAGVALTSVDMKDNYLSINGKAESNSRISVFMVNLESQKIFTNPNLEEIKSSESTNEQSDEVSFILQTSFIG